jgi:hypothetical protein
MKDLRSRPPFSIWTALAIILALAFFGCVSSEQYTLNEVSLSGPAAETPLYVTIDPQPGTVQLVPRVAFDIHKRFEGSLVPSPQVIGQPSAITRSSGGTNNLTWALPRSEYGLDLRYTASENLDFIVGGTFASADGNQFGNLRLGVGAFTVRNNAAIRFDVGVQLSSVRYRSRSTVTTEVDYLWGRSQYVSYFDDTGSEQTFGALLGLTFNTAYRQSPVNGFLHVGVAWQPLLNYRPIVADSILGGGDNHTPVGNINSTSAILSFAGGLALEMGSGNRLLAGVRALNPLGIDALDPSPLWQPFVQIVFTL